MIGKKENERFEYTVITGTSPRDRRTIRGTVVSINKDPKSYASFIREKSNKAKEDAAAKQQATELKKELDKVILEFKVKTGDGDRVFGSISVKQIKDELTKKEYKVEKSQIEIVSQIASLGFHNVNINLYPGITAVVKVHVIK